MKLKLQQLQREQASFYKIVVEFTILNNVVTILYPIVLILYISNMHGCTLAPKLVSYSYSYTATGCAQVIPKQL